MLLMYSGIKFKVSELINIFILSCHLISNISVVFSITKDNKSFCFVVNSLDKWCINQDNRTYLQFLFIQLYFRLTDLPPATSIKLNFIIFFPEALGVILQKHNDTILLLEYWEFVASGLYRIASLFCLMLMPLKPVTKIVISKMYMVAECDIFFVFLFFKANFSCSSGQW